MVGRHGKEGGEVGAGLIKMEIQLVGTRAQLVDQVRAQSDQAKTTYKSIQQWIVHLQATETKSMPMGEELQPAG